jgi:hypothetical protein
MGGIGQSDAAPACLIRSCSLSPHNWRRPGWRFRSEPGRVADPRHLPTPLGVASGALPPSSKRRRRALHDHVPLGRRQLLQVAAISKHRTAAGIHGEPKGESFEEPTPVRSRRLHKLFVFKDGADDLRLRQFAEHGAGRWSPFGECPGGGIILVRESVHLGDELGQSLEQLPPREPVKLERSNRPLVLVLEAFARLLGNRMSLLCRSG